MKAAWDSPGLLGRSEVEIPQAVFSMQCMRRSVYLSGAGESMKSGQSPEQVGKGLILHRQMGVGRKALPARLCQNTHM